MQQREHFTYEKHGLSPASSDATRANCVASLQARFSLVKQWFVALLRLFQNRRGTVRRLLHFEHLNRRVPFRESSTARGDEQALRPLQNHNAITGQVDLSSLLCSRIVFFERHLLLLRRCLRA